MLLAIDTATQILSLALHDGDTLIGESTLRAGRQHSALLAPLIERTLAQTGVGRNDLAALAVAVGPGSYTGVRIGVALAKGMAAPSQPALGTGHNAGNGHRRAGASHMTICRSSPPYQPGDSGSSGPNTDSKAMPGQNSAYAPNQRLGGDSVTL